MQRKYEAGDEKQLDKLIEIVLRPDYPYATRRAAAKALGELGDPRAMPALVNALSDFDQRTSLKVEALNSLGLLGDTTAVDAIGRLLDYSLREDAAEIRLAAIPVLGKLPCTRSAEILVNALSFYDLVILRQESRQRRGLFTGEELPDPYADRRRSRSDSTRTIRRNPEAPMIGRPYDTRPRPFGLDSEIPVEEPVDTIPQELELTRAALLAVGQPAIPVINRHILEERLTPSLRRELTSIAEEILKTEVLPGSAQLASPRIDSN